MKYALGSVKHRGVVLSAIRVDSKFWPLSAAAERLGVAGIPQRLIDVFARWSETRDAVQAVADGIAAGRVPGDLALDDEAIEIVLPLQHPRKVFCVGANYADHLEEMGVTIEKVPGRAPFFFLKPPTTSLSGPGEVQVPPGCRNFDWEAEVVVVFGRGGRDIPVESALDHVAGYTLGIDFTARDQFAAPHLPFQFDFVLGKCQDDTTPIGPVIVPKEFVDGDRLPFRLSVNGTVKQDGTTARMIYSLAEQISGVSRAVQIEPGDILFTGSPAGVGAARGESLGIGDIVVVESAPIGRLDVCIRAARAGRP